MRAFDGALLRSRRLATGKRIELVALEVGRSVESIRAYESGRAAPPIVVATALADSLDTDLDALLTEVAS